MRSIGECKNSSSTFFDSEFFVNTWSFRTNSFILVTLGKYHSYFLSFASDNEFNEKEIKMKSET